MADEEHIARLCEGVEAWNAWRRNTNISPDLSYSDLSYFTLDRINLQNANLSEVICERTSLVGAKLSRANLHRGFFVEANLSGAVLRGVNSSGADFAGANMTDADCFGAGFDAVEFIGANLRKCNLREADLTLARFRSTRLEGAKFKGAVFDGTLFAQLDLSEVLELDQAEHYYKSSIDAETISVSKNLSGVFLRGIGFTSEAVRTLEQVLQGIDEFWSCFISYSHKDQKFARRLHSDLQANGIACWFAPHDMTIGSKNLDSIFSAINNREKLLLILSKNSIASGWVEDEVHAAFESERYSRQTKLFPVRIDDAVMKSNEAWAAKVRQRHIGDFRSWKNGFEYESSFQRLKRDLRRDRPK